MPALTLPGRVAAAAAALAVALPTFIAYNLPPSATFLNQAAALVGWGVFLLVLATALPRGAWRLAASAAPLLAALGLLLGAALLSPLWTGLPASLALSSGGAIAAALLAAACGAALQRAGLGVSAFRALCVGLVVAGLGGTLIALVQVFAPGWADGSVIARSSIAGRAVGNLRQPNHLSSLLLWGVVALVALARSQRWPRGTAMALAALLLFGVELSGSRTGALGALMLAAWGLADRRLERVWRVALGAAPFAYAAMWAVMMAWVRSGAGPRLESRFVSNGDISSSRFGIWSNTIELIRAHPWTGVGWGEFNFAWTLTPFPGRPVAFFDHTHNLVLQFAVELGVPLALAVLGLLGWALWRAARAAWTEPDPARAAALRAGFVMVAMVAIHSQLEYPLWYVYFLLPTAFVWGLGLGADRAPPALSAPSATLAMPAPPRFGALSFGALLLWLAGLLSVLDYARVVVIFAPPEGAAPLAQRIADGRRSVLFAHHADYAAATTPGLGGDVLAGFAGAPHYLLDARLMQAWAQALERSGDTLRAVHVAQRLREFHNDTAEPFFEICDEPDAVIPRALFQCRSAPTGLGYLDFR
ncbi:MAG: Wzy polymerase domain-containing protein [Burkholderiaceae bacterium]